MQEDMHSRQIRKTPALEQASSLNDIFIFHSHKSLLRELSRMENLPHVPRVSYGASFQDAMHLLDSAEAKPGIIFSQLKNLSGNSGAHLYEWVRQQTENLGDVPFVFVSADEDVITFVNRLREKDANVFAICVGSGSYQEQLADVLREVAQLYQFDISQIQSEFFSLPLARRINTRPLEPPTPVCSLIDAGYRNVLIVEDEPAISKLLGYNLSRMLVDGATVSQCSDGIAAVEHFKSADTKPDLIIMDAVMPYLSGDEAVRQIRRYEMVRNMRLRALLLPTENPTRILFTTASPELFESLAADEPGLISVLEKPWGLHELATAIAGLEPISRGMTSMKRYAGTLTPSELAQNTTLALDLLTTTVSYSLQDGVRHEHYPEEAPIVAGRPI